MMTRLQRNNCRAQAVTKIKIKAQPKKKKKRYGTKVYNCLFFNPFCYNLSPAAGSHGRLKQLRISQKHQASALCYEVLRGVERAGVGLVAFFDQLFDVGHRHGTPCQVLLQVPRLLRVPASGFVYVCAYKNMPPKFSYKEYRQPFSTLVVIQTSTHGNSSFRVFHSLLF